MEINEYVVTHDNNMHPMLEIAHKYNYDGQCKNNTEIVNMLNDIFRMNRMAEEYLYVVAQNYNLDILGVYQLSHGNFKETKADNRELFIFLLLVGAERFIIAHNHPSGTLVKSEGDIAVTFRIKEFANTLAIDFAEHFIISKDGYSQLIEQLPENIITLFDYIDNEKEYKYYVTDDVATEINNYLLSIKEIEDREECVCCFAINVCEKHYELEEDEFYIVLEKLNNKKKRDVIKCKEIHINKQKA